MNSITVAGTGLRCSRFVFGTASLLNAGSASHRRRILDAAVDHGFTHFDTAPLYGFGVAERDLAPVLAAHPHLTVTTKVGLLPPGGSDQAKPTIVARKIGGRIFKGLSRPVRSFDLTRVEKSFADSLRRLQRDHVDLLMLHEPTVDILDIEEWVTWLDKRKAAGQIGDFGIAGCSGALPDFLQVPGNRIGNVIQTLDSLDQREADVIVDAGRPLQLTFGYVSAARKRGDQSRAVDILARALARNRTGAILVTTNHIERMAQYADALAVAA